jgi:hypothetical protein
MNWGKISSEFQGFGWKRLSPHEIQADVSHGHEFQGISALRYLLKTNQNVDFPAIYYRIADDQSGNPIIEDYTCSTASWYDCREKDDNRSAEWRLYYPAEASIIQKTCSADDLLIIGLRHNGSLSVMLIQQGSRAESAISNLIGINRLQTQGQGQTRVIHAESTDIGVSATETLEHLATSFSELALDSIPPPLPRPTLDFSNDSAILSVAEMMLRTWPTKLGTCNDIHDTVLEHSQLSWSDLSNNPDDSLVRLLEVAEGAYRIWESSVLETRIGNIRFNEQITNQELAKTISEAWMSLRQGRVSRAGTMMELFLVSIFNASQLNFERNSKIEGGKKPDFLFPGASSYNDVKFPADKLRILGSKTSFKDRWRQILAEGNRVTAKHGATRDNAITSSIFDQMAAESFTVVMPNPILKTYSYRPKNMISLTEFISSIRDIATS